MTVLVSILLLLMFSVRDVAAHETGLSRGEYEVNGRELTARLTFASKDVASATPDTLARGLIVRGDDAPCPTSFVSAAPLETDGTLITLRSVCERAPRSVVVEAFFLSELPFGHKHLARVAGADTTLTIAKRTFTVAPNQPRTSFLWMGVEHILTGYDHLVFLLGLILVGRARELLGIVTAFTLGHSISLALATLGVWVPSARVVEPLIALSIVYVGIENLYTPKHRWRIAAPFGLIHGFGFASALREMALPRAELPRAIALFNLGVELGQLAVLAALIPVALFVQKRPRVQRVTSIAVAIAGFAWFALRVLRP